MEQRVEMDPESSNNRFGRMPKTVGRYSAIVSNKKDNEIAIDTTITERSQRQNKENDNKYTSNTTKNATRGNYRWSAPMP